MEIDITPSPCAQKEYVAFGCLNYFAKASDAALNCWAQILQRVHKSRLFILVPEGSCRKRVVEKFEIFNVESSRITFVTQQGILDYFKTFRDIDIALDPFPFNGGTTSCDALWMGVPIVSLAGDRPVARAGLSLLTNLNLTDLSANSPDEYVEIASTLAQNTNRLVNLRTTLRTLMRASPLMDAARFGKAFSDLLEKAFTERMGRECHKSA
jgi:protein O-GlcNAc transferase